MIGKVEDKNPDEFNDQKREKEEKEKILVDEMKENIEQMKNSFESPCSRLSRELGGYIPFGNMPIPFYISGNP